MRTCLFIVLLGVAAPPMAQALPDSGLPDASVEGGSAEGMTEENDPQGGPCLLSKDCAQGFGCVNARCVPTKAKNVGCTVVPGAALLAGAIVLVLKRRRG